jgi:hypothetical protein
VGGDGRRDVSALRFNDGLDLRLLLVSQVGDRMTLRSATGGPTGGICCANSDFRWDQQTVPPDS